MEKPRTFWNGLATDALRGTMVVDTEGLPETNWAVQEGLDGERIAVVRVNLDGVNYGGGVSWLDDRDGSGWRKVTEGHGGPRWPHREVPVKPGTFRLTSAG